MKKVREIEQFDKFYVCTKDGNGEMDIDELFVKEESIVISFKQTALFVSGVNKDTGLRSDGFLLLLEHDDVVAQSEREAETLYRAARGDK